MYWFLAHITQYYHVPLYNELIIISKEAFHQVYYYFIEF